MQSMLLAIAGLAEAAMAMVRLMMGTGLLVIGLFALPAMLKRSRELAITAIVLLAAFCIVFQPWYCFAPFDAEDYGDSDTEYHAARFRHVGVCWVAVSSFVAWRHPAVAPRQPVVDWDAKYAAHLKKNPSVAQAVKDGRISKERVIAGIRAHLEK